MLHIINRSPHDARSIEDCQDFIQEDDAIILIEDAVVAAFKGHETNSLLQSMMKKAQVYILKADLQARGNLGLISGIKPVDYDGFVDIVESHDKSMSWL